MHDNKTRISLSTLIVIIKEEETNNKYFKDINELVISDSIKKDFCKNVKTIPNH